MQFRVLVVVAALAALRSARVRGCALECEVAGGIRHQGGAERALERGDLPLGEGGRDRSHLRGRLEQPRRSATSTKDKFDEARKAYEKAVALDPKNLLIRQNYDLFKEINDRAKRRNDR